MSKAARGGIGLIGVMKKGDRRIRISVTQEPHTRKLTVEYLNIVLKGVQPIDHATPGFQDIYFDGAHKF